MVLPLKGKICICFSLIRTFSLLFFGAKQGKNEEINKIKYVSRLESFSIFLFNDF